MNIGFKYAFKGIKRMLQTERNFKIHVFLFLLLICVCFYFHISKLEWCMILGLSALVFSLEMINSSIERLCNKLALNKDADIAWIKDVAAGAVLIAAIFSTLIALLIFMPYILELCTTFGL